MKRLVIVGPTASGKTQLALKVASRFNGEIIAADSRTIYKGMDIGTAKPTRAEQKTIKHHCIDIVYPDTEFTVADFIKVANISIDRIEQNGKLPIIVGGSGLYVDSLIYNFSFIPPRVDIRVLYENMQVERLQAEIIAKGYKMPENKRNKRYLISALEHQGQQPNKGVLKKGTLIIGINPGKEVLAANISSRALKMINAGAIQEAEVLFAKYGQNAKCFNGGIYKILPNYISGNISRQQLVDQFIKSDLKLAEKQLTWFKRNKDITWFGNEESAFNWLGNRLLE